ncbi:putative acetyltransferase [Acaromyces ingoldii]|uniref:Putative acetyltransferase n=1 Tax=Acaromyces ingoldii TaxID=215250 RepID=A0A316YQY2_9BASI|nr:putative acetyltransferase [Acaromyces ingoldii]PWN91078.1 putative acetyltransferase [Acaromyces ingoldii]
MALPQGVIEDEIEVVEVAWDDREAVRLRQMQRDDIAGEFPLSKEPGPPPSVSDCLVFLIARRRGEAQALAAGGLRRVDDKRAEVKRMYVVPQFRGRPLQLGQKIVEALERRARQLGFSQLLLETGTFMAGPRKFYERCGYQQDEAFPPYLDAPQSVFYAKDI